MERRVLPRARGHTRAPGRLLWAPPPPRRSRPFSSFLSILPVSPPPPPSLPSCRHPVLVPANPQSLRAARAKNPRLHRRGAWYYYYYYYYNYSSSMRAALLLRVGIRSTRWSSHRLGAHRLRSHVGLISSWAPGWPAYRIWQSPCRPQQIGQTPSPKERPPLAPGLS